MRRIPALLAFLAAHSLQAQVVAPRSATYLFSANVEDARALWINPAGLGILREASIYGELAADRATTNEDWGVRQYSMGLLSRSLAFSYQRDRPVTGGSQGTWRVGTGFPLGRRIALGTAVSFTSPERGIDVGVRFAPARTLDLGLVMRNIGRPSVRGTKQTLIGVGGLSWRVAGGRLGFQADAIATERAQSGFDVRYRTGAIVTLPGRTPLTLLTAFDWGDHLLINQWSLGVGIGFAAQALMVGTALPQTGSSTRLESFNVTAVARGRTQPRPNDR